MVRSVEAIVVGAGAVGGACAYLLARAGLNVALVEADAVASGASSHATGFFSLATSDFRTHDHLQLGVDSYVLTRELIPKLQAETDIDVLYQLAPFVRVALTPNEEELIRGQMADQAGLVSCRWIDGDELRRLEPRLSPAIRGAAYQDECAQLDSARFTLALATGAEHLGAEILTQKTLGLLWDGTSVAGVRLPHDEMQAPIVVLAMGTWAPVAEAWLGVTIPVRPLKGENLLLRMDGPPLPVLISSPSHGHLISRRDGLLSVGSTAGRDLDDQGKYVVDATTDERFAVPTTEEALVELVERASEILSDVENSVVVEQRAGVRPLTPDRLPIIGPVSGHPGVLIATGHGTKGIHLAVGTAQLITDMVLGRSGAVQANPAAFAVERFQSIEATFSGAAIEVDD